LLLNVVGVVSHDSGILPRVPGHSDSEKDGT